MVKRENYASDAPWEAVVGYSRAVRVAQFIYVSGTTATDEKGNIVGEGDPYKQTIQALRNIDAALKKAGGSLQDVVRTRMYVTDMGNWEKIGKAHGEVFGPIRPASTLVEVSRLIDKKILVEIECDAVVQENKRYYQTQQIPEKKIMGIEVRTTNDPGRAEKEIPELWDRFFDEGIMDKIPGMVSHAVVALYTDYQSDHTKPYTVVIGCEVRSLDSIPAGLVGRLVPASKCAVFPVSGQYPESLMSTWAGIWNTPLPRTYMGDYEVYPPDFDPNTRSDLKVYIAVE